MRAETDTIAHLDSLKRIKEIVITHVSDTDTLIVSVKTFMIVIAMMVNALLFAVMPTLIYCLIRFPEFRTWFMRMLEDDDGRPQKVDAKDAMILFFAYIVGWTLIDLIFGATIFDKDWIIMIGAVTLIWGGLLGISFNRK